MPDDKKDNQEEKSPQAAPLPAPPGKPQEAIPQALQLKVVSNGDPAGTRLVDAGTGQTLAFDCHGRCDLSWHPRAGGSARVVLVFSDVPVETEGDVKTPFEFHGVVAGQKGGALPEGVTMAPLAGVAPLPAGPSPGGVAGSSRGIHLTPEQVRAANERFNAEAGGRR
jgi:hypothetical protein